MINDKILKDIDLNKEILSTLPKNNENNIEKYLEKTQNLRHKYLKYKKGILEEIEKRYNDIKDIKPNRNISKLKEQITDIEKCLYFLNDIKTSYEKMGLDKIIYKLTKFYKENLDNINEEVLKAIRKFSEVGVVLRPSDFDYSSYVQEYMEMFFSQINLPDINTDKLDEKFEEIYWQCPELIIHIEINFRFLYIKHQGEIDKYFAKQQSMILKKLNGNIEMVKEKYIELMRVLDYQKNIDSFLILEQFENKKVNIKDFTPDKIDGAYKKILPSEMLEKADEQGMEEINFNISKFLNTLYEYKNYLKFRYLFKDIQEKYKQKESYKNIYSTTKKELANQEKQLKKLNNKMSGKCLFGKKKKDEKQTAEYSQLVMQIKDQYRELDINKICEKIYTQLEDTSTIYDVFYFIDSFHNYISKTIIKENPDITQDEIEKEIIELEEFIKSPYNTFINNITILEEKDIAMIIKDRYSLLGFTIEKEQVDEENLDNIIATLEIIQMNINIKRSGLTVEKIGNLMDFQKILNDNVENKK